MMGVSVTLVLAAVVAGLATFLSPCVLPIVPVVLATGATGGRRRPLGVALGLALAFVVFTLAASRVLAALGLPQDLLHTIAVVLLAFAGLVLLVPSLAEWAGRLFQPLAARAGGRVPGGDGFALRPPAGCRALGRLDALRRADPGGRDRSGRGASRLGQSRADHDRVRRGRHAAAVPARAARPARRLGLRPGAQARPRAAAGLRRRPPARRVAVHDQPADAAGGGDAGLSLLDPEPGARLRDQDRPARPRHVEGAFAGGAGRGRLAGQAEGLRACARISPASARGSTRPGRSRSRCASCAARSCWSTSGRTPA